MKCPSYRSPICRKCRASDAETHPLEVGAIITVLEFCNGYFAAEGEATILRSTDEADVYFIKFRGDERIEKRLVLPDYQRNAARLIEVLNRHINRHVDADNRSQIPARGTTA